ncbi:universal stress protein [Haliangium sp.]|uniref:universal stress protein n=1 Tax=Haliangium sp. TaxID=2663208 RepID=UPI003D128305
MIERILFASDFSNITERAQEYTLNIARAVGASVTLIHSIEPIEGAIDDDYVAKLLSSRKQGAESQAQSVLKAFKEAGVPCSIRIEVGRRWKTIVEAAGSGEYDLVILGSHKIHEEDKVYLGTTTHKVFFAVDVPLLVVPYK